MFTYFTISRAANGRVWSWWQPVLILTLVLFFSTASVAQKADSLLQRADELTRISTPEVDTLVQVDSLRIVMQLDSVSARLNSSIDSLGNLKLPSDQYYAKLDSLIGSTQNRLSHKFSSATDSLKDKQAALLTKYNSKLQTKKQKLDSLLRKNGVGSPQIDIEDKIATGDFKMPAVDSPDFNKPDLPGVDINVPSLSSDLPNLNVNNMNVDLIPKEFSEVKDAASKAQALKSESEKYGAKIEEAKKIDVKEEAKKLPETVEKEIKDLDQVKEITREIPSKDMVKDQVDDMKSAIPDATNVEGEVRKRTQKQMKDYFAGKDETVNTAITKLEKLQKHYNNVTDMRKLPDRKPNNMKGKPFIERFVPGMMIQVIGLESAWKRIDFSPNANYWFHHKFRAGVGGTYRVNLDASKFNITTHERVYGFRAYGDYKLHKSFFAHLEGEAIRLNKPVASPASESVREWEYAINTGLFKTYKINKFTRGTAVLLYNLFSLDETFNVNRIAVRFGVEFTFKKKKEKPLPFEVNR